MALSWPCTVSPVVWHVPHAPGAKVRLATSVEPLNFVFVSQIDGFDLGVGGGGLGEELNLVVIVNAT